MRISLYFVSILIIEVPCEAAVGQSCQDIDHTACVDMAKQNANLCSNPVLKTSACPRFCNSCPITCYNCNVSTPDVSACNTMTCGHDQTCMIKEVGAMSGGKHSYTLACEKTAVCNGNRNSYSVYTDCCHTDLCNRPIVTTTTTPTTSMPTTTTLTTPMPTTTTPTTSMPTTTTPTTLMPTTTTPTTPLPTTTTPTTSMPSTTAVTPSASRLVRTTDCPDRWVAFQGACYSFGNGANMTFYEGDNFCRQQKGGHLVEVHSHNENLFLKDFLRDVEGYCFWNGLTDENIEGIWVWYNSQTTPEFFDWGPHDPNGGNAHDCVVFYSRENYDYRWSDAPCSGRCMPVCKIRVNTGVIVGK